jgi:hypothetical protein
MTEDNKPTKLQRLFGSIRGVVRSPLPILIISVGLNVVLAGRVNVLQSAVRTLKSDGRLKIGTKVSAIEGTTVDKSPLSIRFNDTNVPTVLYVMRPGCIWCQRNHSNLKTLLAEAGSKYRFFVVSLEADGAAKYQADHPVSATMITNLSENTKREFKLGGTPQTLVISPAGVVLKNWVGAYTGPNESEVQKEFSVKLPGLLEIPHEPVTNKGGN